MWGCTEVQLVAPLGHCVRLHGGRGESKVFWFATVIYQQYSVLVETCSLTSALQGTGYSPKSLRCSATITGQMGSFLSVNVNFCAKAFSVKGPCLSNVSLLSLAAGVVMLQSTIQEAPD